MLVVEVVWDVVVLVVLDIGALELIWVVVVRRVVEEDAAVDELELTLELVVNVEDMLEVCIVVLEDTAEVDLVVAAEEEGRPEPVFWYTFKRFPFPHS